MQTSRGTIQPTYSNTTGTVTSLAEPAGEGLAYTYDGRPPLGTLTKLAKATLEPAMWLTARIRSAIGTEPTAR